MPITITATAEVEYSPKDYDSAQVIDKHCKAMGIAVPSEVSKLLSKKASAKNPPKKTLNIPLTNDDFDDDIDYDNSKEVIIDLSDIPSNVKKIRIQTEYTQ